MYAFVGERTKEALVTLRVEEINKAVKVLKEAGITVVSDHEVCSL